MADAAEIEALRVAWATSLERAQEASSLDVAMLFRAPLFEPQDSAGFLEVLPAFEQWASWRFGSLPTAVPLGRGATSARGTADVANGSAAPVSFATGELVLERAGVHYRNLEPIFLAVGKSKTARIEAEAGGEGGTALAGSTLTLDPPIVGVTAVAASDLVGGDAVSWLELLTALRNLDAFSTFLRGLRRADLTPRFVTRGRDAEGLLSVAGPSGALSSPDIERVRTLLRAFPARTALGFDVSRIESLESATTAAVPVAYTLQVLDELDGVPTPPNVDLAAAIAARLADLVKTIPIGPTTLRRSVVDTAARAALGMVVTSEKLPTLDALSRYPGAPSALVSLTITAPAADVVLAPHEVAVLGAITPSITRL